jgi:hypothetical protein
LKLRAHRVSVGLIVDQKREGLTLKIILVAGDVAQSEALGMLAQMHLGIALVAKWESADVVPSQIVSNEPDQICNLRTLTLEQAKAEANPESWTAKILASGLLEKFV